MWPSTSGADIKSDLVIEADLSSRPFRVRCDPGDAYLAETLIVATGLQAKWLEHRDRAEVLQGFGAPACATATASSTGASRWW